MKYGIVLSGGMAKGALQIGALYAINEIIQNVDIISACSVGILNGYAYATGKLDDAKKMWLELCDSNTRIFVGDLLKSYLLQKDIKKLCSCTDTFSCDLLAALFDSVNRSIVYKNLLSVDKNKLSDYIKASVSVPIYNHGTVIGNGCYYDGGVLDNIPVTPLLEKELDFIICVYFDNICYTFENPEFDKKIIKITFPTKNLIKESAIFEKSRIENMINEGYEKTKNILSFVLGNDTNDADKIYSRISFLNDLTKTKKIRITGDVFVTNLNRITKRLVQKKIIF